MTVRQLANKLKKFPEDAIITVANDDLFVNGEYVATGIEYYKEDNTVLIETNYKKKLGDKE
jgi:hypothetical protein